MKVILLGAMLGKGVSTKSGQPKPYELNSIEYVVPSKDYIQGDHNIQKCGFTVKSVQMAHDQTLYNKVATIANEGIAEVELTLSPDPENMARNIVTDVRLAK
tara:strand:+ start:513 stop:818 length:306 start_codon:yes stop_codon:yes gene_type:complete